MKKEAEFNMHETWLNCNGSILREKKAWIFLLHGYKCASKFSCDDESQEIHHADGDRRHNDFDNLLPVCIACHYRLDYELGKDNATYKPESERAMQLVRKKQRAYQRRLIRTIKERAIFAGVKEIVDKLRSHDPFFEYDKMQFMKRGRAKEVEVGEAFRSMFLQLNA